MTQITAHTAWKPEPRIVPAIAYTFVRYFFGNGEHHVVVRD